MDRVCPGRQVIGEELRGRPSVSSRGLAQRGGRDQKVRTDVRAEAPETAGVFCRSQHGRLSPVPDPDYPTVGVPGRHLLRIASPDASEGSLSFRRAAADTLPRGSSGPVRTGGAILGGSHGDRARQRAQVPERPFLGRFGTLPAFSVARRKSEAIRCALLARPLGGEPRKVCGCALPSEPLRQCYITSLPRGGPAGQRTHYFTPTLQLRRNAPAKNARSHSALVSRSGFPSHNKTEGPFVPAYGRLRSIFLMKPRKFGI